MKLLITGSNGYIARSLINSLSDHDITILNRKIVDLSDFSQLHDWFNDKSFDVVIHCAAVGGSRLINDSENVISDNLKMYYNLLSNKSKFNKLISFGSGAEIFAQTTPYGISKKIIADSIKQTPNFYNIRIFGVFDHNELDTRFIKGNILRYLKKQSMVIHADKIMDFFYMNDLVKIVKYYIQFNDLPKEINCSYKEKLTLKSIANIINTLDNHVVPITITNHDHLQFYCGSHCDLEIEFDGLQKGIIDTFNKLEDLHNATSDNI